MDPRRKYHVHRKAVESLQASKQAASCTPAGVHGLSTWVQVREAGRASPSCWCEGPHHSPSPVHAQFWHSLALCSMSGANSQTRRRLILVAVLAVLPCSSWSQGLSKGLRRCRVSAREGSGPHGWQLQGEGSWDQEGRSRMSSLW